jgi:hypothetical protein
VFKYTVLQTVENDDKTFTVEDEAKSIYDYTEGKDGLSAEEIYKKFIDQAFNSLGPEDVFSPDEELEVLFIEEHKEEIIKELNKFFG